MFGMILLLGIPHGATDEVIFKALKGRVNAADLRKFAALYLLTIGLYAAIWWVVPLWAFGFFLLLSVYHFGQSNLAPMHYGSQLMRYAHYMLWGSYVLFIPILFNLPEAQAIVANMTQVLLPLPSEETVFKAIAVLFGLNVAAYFLLILVGRLSSAQCIRELVHLLVLLLLYANSSLLLGFTVYFVFWHSLASVLDQNNFFQQRLNTYHWRQFVLRALQL
ncbi:MAG: beta-carotene 15,15'-dioxygenase, Brp/Blh family [Lewinella sp.]|nr:beta-carotene 15,15'-dioxygenase, Brp/Blh family [Lewinella sp.]